MADHARRRLERLSVKPAEARAAALDAINGMRARLTWARSVAGDGGLSPSAYRVAAFIAEAYDEAHARFATGRAKIAASLGIAPSTVQEALALLVRRGWLSLARGPSRGKNATEYALVFPMELTAHSRSVEESASDRSRSVGSLHGNRPIPGAQPTDSEAPTDRFEASNRPEAVGPNQDDQGDQGDQTRASARATTVPPQPENRPEAAVAAALEAKGLPHDTVAVGEWVKRLTDDRWRVPCKAWALTAAMRWVLASSTPPPRYSRFLDAGLLEQWIDFGERSRVLREAEPRRKALPPAGDVAEDLAAVQRAIVGDEETT